MARTFYAENLALLRAAAAGKPVVYDDDDDDADTWSVLGPGRYYHLGSMFRLDPCWSWHDENALAAPDEWLAEAGQERAPERCRRYWRAMDRAAARLGGQVGWPGDGSDPDELWLVLPLLPPEEARRRQERAQRLGVSVEEVGRLEAEDEARLRTFLQARQGLPVGRAQWRERAALNRVRTRDYGLPPLPGWPRTRAEADRWADRQEQGLPPDPATPATPATPGSPRPTEDVSTPPPTSPTTPSRPPGTRSTTSRRLSWN